VDVRYQDATGSEWSTSRRAAFDPKQTWIAGSARIKLAAIQRKSSLIRTLTIAAKVIWAVSIIALSTAVGTAYGWQNHGPIGATALGFVGLVVGVFLAASPMFVLQLLQ
jgi:uncharacterized membrane protein YcjF (UPF0283 family)